MAFLGRRRGGADILITSLAVVPGDEIARGRRAHFDSTLPRGLGAATSSSTASSHEQLLLAAAAEVFATSGVDAPIRAIAARAGVGHATIYRHFPTRADLVVAVYRHQVEACAEEGASLLAGDERPADALEAWVGSFVDFLVTKHGLADMLRSDSDTFGALHASFLDRLVPVCEALLDAAVDAGQARPGYGAYELMRGIGNLCVGDRTDPGYEPRRLVELLLDGLQR